MLKVDPAKLRQACRVFMELAYPAGPASIPCKKRTYFDLPADEGIYQFLPPSPAAAEICHLLPAGGIGAPGYAVRLGSAHFPHLKLKLQIVDVGGTPSWVYMVDTHDAFSRDSVQPPPSHPDAPGWTALQAANRELKERIEHAFEAAGLPTFNSLLRGGLHA